MEQWSDSSCLGYAIKALKAMGKSDNEIQEIVYAIRANFDWVSVEEAADIYNKSNY